MPSDQKGEPQDENDHYEPAALAEPSDLDEDARLKRIEEAEDRESRREILLGQIAMARSALYEAQEAGDAAKAATLEQRIADLTRERNGL